MERKELKVKEWVIDKAQKVAGGYNCYIDFTRRDANMCNAPLVEDGYVYVLGEIIQETEKALKVKLETGSVVGSCKGWTTWIPKSQMA